MSAETIPEREFIERAFRQRTYKSAFVFNDGCGGKRPCILRNVSETGALLQIDDVGGLPSQFKMAVELDAYEVDVKWIWRQEAKLGVEFQGPLQNYQSTRKQVMHLSDDPTLTGGANENQTKMQLADLRQRLANEAAERERLANASRIRRRSSPGFGKR